MLRAALDVAFDEGLSGVSFGRVAKRLGTSDRMVVYYFPTKDDLVTEVVMAMGAQLQGTLAEAFTDRVDDHRELVRLAWPVVTTSAADRVFALFFEANGLATAGRQPFADLVPQLVELWIAWVSGFIDGSEDHQRAEAEAVIALVDGLLLLRQLGGADAAERAARRLGVLT